MAIIRELSKLAEQRLGLAKLLFSFEIKPFAYDESESFQMELWRAFEKSYIDHKGSHLSPINEPIWALFQCFFPPKMCKTVSGIGKIIKSSEDALVKAGVIAKRDCIESYDLSRKLISNMPPRLTIFLFEMPTE